MHLLLTSRSCSELQPVFDRARYVVWHSRCVSACLQLPLRVKRPSHHPASALQVRVRNCARDRKSCVCATAQGTTNMCVHQGSQHTFFVPYGERLAADGIQNGQEAALVAVLEHSCCCAVCEHAHAAWSRAASARCKRAPASGAPAGSCDGLVPHDRYFITGQSTYGRVCRVEWAKGSMLLDGQSAHSVSDSKHIKQTIKISPVALQQLVARPIGGSLTAKTARPLLRRRCYGALK